jgi:hypothetical protein
VGAGGRIAGAQHLDDVAIEAVAAAVLEYGAQSRLQSNPVMGLFAYRHVGLQAKQRAAPISTRPGVRLIHAALARSRQAARHFAPILGPYVADVPVARLRARNPFHIHRQPFGQPIVRAADFGQRQMHHFVHHHPVRAQHLGRRFPAHGGLNHQSVIVGGASAVYPGAVAAAQPQHDQGRGKATVVGGDDVRRAFNPGLLHGLQFGRGGLIEHETECRLAHLQTAGGLLRAARRRLYFVAQS